MTIETGEQRLTVRPQLFCPRIPRATQCTCLPGMSAVQTWTLWQRLPPRYQLTSHVYDSDADEFVVTGTATDRTLERTQSPRTRMSPRPLSSGRKSSRREPQAASYRENFMLSNNDPDAVQKEISRTLKQQTSRSFSFPKRNSDYVNTFQRQMRVNSARRRLAEAPPSPGVAPSQQMADTTDAPRAHTAPVFPVTCPETHKVKQPKLSDTRINIPEVKSPRISLNAKSKPVGEPSKVDVFHFDDSKSVSSSSSSVTKPKEVETKPKKYIVQDTNRATVYIDSGKVMYFGKSRHDLTQLLKTQSLRADRNNCFLAEIRRDYLKHPKYERGRSVTTKKTDSDPRRIASERIDYNRRVEHILNYYDDDGNVSQKPRSRPTSGRIKSPKGARVKGLSLTPAAPSRPPSRAVSPGGDNYDNSDFIRLNKQLKLHKRQFYLRTPGMQHGNNIMELDKCRCSMCRMELQLALVTGFTAHTDLSAGSREAGAQNDKRKDNILNEFKEKTIDSKTSKSDVAGKTSTQKVSFQNPEVDLVAQAQETRFISCKLPEVDQMTVSESGFESARTHDVVSVCRDDITCISET